MSGKKKEKLKTTIILFAFPLAIFPFIYLSNDRFLLEIDKVRLSVDAFYL